MVSLAYVDDDDFDYLSQWSWCLTTTGYARRNKDGKISKMHREILGITDKNIKIDHKNKDKLDNRKCNLRLVTTLQNGWNSSCHKNGTTSKYKGVHWSKDRNKWVASIGYKSSVIPLGRFLVEKDAALAYNNAATKYYGEYASLNEVI